MTAPTSHARTAGGLGRPAGNDHAKESGWQ